MFTPPPSEENVLIVKQSVSTGLSVNARLLQVAGCVVAAAISFVLMDEADLWYPQEVVVTEEIDVSAEVVGGGFPAYPVDAVPRLIAELDALDSKLWKKNGEVLRARAPVSIEPPSVSVAPLTAFESSPLAPPLPAKRELVASSGPWLNGLVKISGSGLRLFSGGVAVFEKGGQRVVFQEGQVLPNGEVVISVDDRALLIETDVRQIQLIDDGA